MTKGHFVFRNFEFFFEAVPMKPVQFRHICRKFEFSSRFNGRPKSHIKTTSTTFHLSVYPSDIRPALDDEEVGNFYGGAVGGMCSRSRLD